MIEGEGVLMLKKVSSRLRAVLQALFVTFLWATSWVLVKPALGDIPPLPFAGLRYSIAFLCLLPFALRSTHPHLLRRLSRDTWVRLLILGLLFYALTQGAVFLSLFYLPATTVNLLLSFSTVVVALLGILTLGERPTILQWGGLLLYLGGVLVYFYPASLPLRQVLGVIVAITGVLANSLSSILGRHINRSREVPPITVTVISMGVGSISLLVGGILVQGLPPLSLTNWVVVLWLAVVNSAFAFTLWNHTLRTLSAMESSIINSTLLIQIPILAYVFLGERFTGREGLGMLVAGLGVLIVQLQRQERQ
jgi:drug/metabolite transporter (DMT)-like permease